MKFHSDWEIAQWSFVEKIASNDLTRVIGLIPLVGYIILFNDELAELASFGTIGGVESDDISPFFLSSLAKMRFVFFGSLFLLLANVTFRCFSPPALRQSKDDIGFSTRVRDCYSVHELANMEDAVFSEHWKPRASFFWNVRDMTRSRRKVVSGYRPDCRAEMFGKHGDYINFLAREWWVGQMHTHRGARISSLIFGCIGYILLALPTLDISQAVLSDVINSIWVTVN
jgi:hypothetical protein